VKLINNFLFFYYDNIYIVERLKEGSKKNEDY
jgi:hypothetical protein